MDGVLSPEEWPETGCVSGPTDLPLLIDSAVIGSPASASTGVLLLRPTPVRCNRLLKRA